jgi:hypothetical protein
VTVGHAVANAETLVAPVIVNVVHTAYASGAISTTAANAVLARMR